MMGYPLKCYLCDSWVTWAYDPQRMTMQRISCRECGRYRISEMLITKLIQKENWPKTKTRLRDAVRWANTHRQSVDVAEVADIVRLIEVYDRRDRTQES
jgi:hypothetical protein